VLLSFVEHEAQPPASPYDVGTEVYLQAGIEGLSGSQVQGDFSGGGTVTVEDVGGLVITFTDVDGISGDVVCL
jgi:hypothetical protein